MDRDLSYYIRRADEERSAAERAHHVAARDAHLQMARHYEARVAAARTTPTAVSAMSAA